MSRKTSRGAILKILGDTPGEWVHCRTLIGNCEVFSEDIQDLVSEGLIESDGGDRTQIGIESSFKVPA